MDTIRTKNPVRVPETITYRREEKKISNRVGNPPESIFLPPLNDDVANRREKAVRKGVCNSIVRNSKRDNSIPVPIIFDIEGTFSIFKEISLDIRPEPGTVVPDISRVDDILVTLNDIPSIDNNRKQRKEVFRAPL